MRTLSVLTAAAVAMAAAAAAHVGVKDPAVMARMHNMKDSAAALEVLGGMAKGEVPFDAARAASAKADLVALSARVPELFEGGETDPLTEARREIWETWAAFELRAEAAETAIEALNTTSPAEIAAGLRAVGAACSACHEDYRLDQ